MFLIKFHRLDNGNVFFIADNQIESVAFITDDDGEHGIAVMVGGRYFKVREDLGYLIKQLSLATKPAWLRKIYKWFWKL